MRVRCVVVSGLEFTHAHEQEVSVFVVSVLASPRRTPSAAAAGSASQTRGTWLGMTQGSQTIECHILVMSVVMHWKQ